MNTLRESKPTIEILTPYLSETLGSTLRALLDDDFSLSVANPQGNLNYTYLVTVPGSCCPSAVLKVKSRSEFEHRITHKLSAPYDKERVVLKRCAAIDLPVASVLGEVVHIDKRLEGAGPFVCLLQRFIKGMNGRLLGPLNTEAELVLLRQVGKIARQVHQIKFKRFGDSVSSSGDFTKSWGAYLDHLFKFPLRTISGFLKGDEHEMFCSRFEELRSIKRQGVLIHSDMHLANMLFDPATGQLTGIVDWERSRSSRPSEEFARILYENFVLGQRFSLAEISQTIRDSGITPQFNCFLSGYGMNPQDYQSSFRRETEGLLMLLCARFWTRWKLEYSERRPDWRAPAQYSEQVVRSVLEQG